MKNSKSNMQCPVRLRIVVNTGKHQSVDEVKGCGDLYENGPRTGGEQ